MRPESPVVGVACEVVGELIVARLQGEPTAGSLEGCQAQIMSLARASGVRGVLYDLRELVLPGTALLHQQALEHEIRALRLRRAVVVPNASIGYLARLAFSADDCPVFYGDYDGAVRCLTVGNPPTSAWSLAVGEDRRIRERRSQVERQLPGRRRPSG